MKKLGAIIFALLLLITILPLLVLVLCSFLPLETANALLAGEMRPLSFTISQFQDLFTTNLYPTMFKNSIKLTFFAVLFHLPISLFAGLMLWKATGKIKKIFMALYIAALLLPFQSIMLPVYQIFQELHIQNSLISVMVLAIFAPLGPLVIAAWLNQMPDDCWEAALLETNSLYKILLHILIPQMLSILLVLGFITIAEVWNMTEQPLILLQNVYDQPLSARFNNTQRGGNSDAYAGSLLYFLPSLAVIVIICIAGKSASIDSISKESFSYKTAA